MVATEPDVALLMVNWLMDDAPFKVKLPVNVWVAPAGKVSMAAVATDLVKFTNVFAPVIVWLVPLKTTVLKLPAVNIPALLQLPVTFSVDDVPVVSVPPLVIDKLPPTLTVEEAAVNILPLVIFKLPEPRSIALFKVTILLGAEPVFAISMVEFALVVKAASVENVCAEAPENCKEQVEVEVLVLLKLNVPAVLLKLPFTIKLVVLLVVIPSLSSIALL